MSGTETRPSAVVFLALLMRSVVGNTKLCLPCVDISDNIPSMSLVSFCFYTEVSHFLFLVKRNVPNFNPHCAFSNTFRKKIMETLNVGLFKQFIVTKLANSEEMWQ